jgi:hypothetical protein
MTPSQIEEAARRRYNSVSDSFWSSDEIFELIYDACLELALETKCIERLFSTTTVASQQDYSFPSNVLAIKRVTYDGKKLKPINMREDDAITGLNQSIASEGSPTFYYQWDYTISLRPLPSDALTLKIWAYVLPSAITSTSTLEIPEEFHMKLVNYIVAEMAAKDSNSDMAVYYSKRWDRAKLDILRWVAVRKRTDAFAVVQDEENSAGTYLGII